MNPEEDSRFYLQEISEKEVHREPPDGMIPTSQENEYVWKYRAAFGLLGGNFRGGRNIEDGRVGRIRYSGLIGASIEGDLEEMIDLAGE